MNGRDKRRKRAERRRNTPPIGSAKSSGLLCWNGCGEPGPHFVPPSFGDPGFYICTPLPSSDAHTEQKGTGR